MPTPSTRHDAPSSSGQRGSIAVYLALALVAFGVLAMAGMGRFSSVVSSVLAPNCATSARYMAESGLRYAMARMRASADVASLNAAVAAMNGQKIDVDAAKGLSFTLQVTYDGNQTAAVTSTGSSCGNLAGASSILNASVNLPGVIPVIDFSDIAVDFFKTASLTGSSPIVVDSAAKTISFGKLGETYNAAAIWYNSNSTGCVDGNCTMNYGLRAYFDIKWDLHNDSADGLVFGLHSAETNTVTNVGGKTSMGELMGWAGPGKSKGLRPPKIGLEFDAYDNDCNSDVTAVGSRCDANTRDHMAYVFWGSTTNVGSSGDTYDDNRHTAGDGTSSQPVSLKNPDGTGSGSFGYYYQGTDKWLSGDNVSTTKYYIRYELSRISSKTNYAGEYPYILKTWVKNAQGSSAYSNVTANYTAETPTMMRVVHLNSTYHTQMRRIFFGWTEATGANTQKLTVGNFNLMFKTTEDLPTVPKDYVSYWNMNEASGTAVLNANATMPGTILGTVNRVTPSNWSYGKALDFSAGTQRVQVADATPLDLTTKGSISLWIYPTTLTNYYNGGIIHKGGSSNASDEAYSIYLNGSTINFLSRWGNQNSRRLIVSSSSLPSANTWYHVAVVWDADIIAIYINGMLNNYSTNPSTSLPRATTGPLMIGTMYNDNAYGTYFPFLGRIDEVYLYNRVLTAEEIAALSFK